MLRMKPLLFGLVVVSVSLPVPSLAEIYKWVDEKGKVHFTDKPPADKKVKQQESRVTTRHTGGGKDFLGTRTAKKLTPIRYNGSSPSQKVKLERIIMDLSKDKGGRTIIGKTHYGPACTPRKGSGYTWSKGRTEIHKKKYSDALAEVFQENNYAVVDSSKLLFNEQKEETAQLSLAAVIKDLQINTCQPSGSYNSRDRKERVASYMKIEWSVFDILSRKVVFSVETEGYSSDNRHDAGLGDLKTLSKMQSFSNAVNNLLANRDFVAVLEQSPVNKTVSLAPLQPLESVHLAYGKKDREFTGVVSALKKATVTIRSVRGHGSGFVLTTDGYVLTNEHVVGDSREAIVVFANKEKRATVVRVDDKRDIALLKLKPDEPYQSVLLSGSAPVEGEPVYIIGTPLDEQFSHTVTRDIISSHRSMDDGNKYYQTDAAINPGNSGGPAFNQHGEVVGIAVAGLFNRAGGSLNINFLIPINEALKVLGL